MLAITCEKCRRRFTPTTEELQGYLTNSQGKKHVLVTCPHCGKGNKVAMQRAEQALRFSPAASPTEVPAATQPGSEADSEQGMRKAE